LAADVLELGVTQFARVPRRGSEDMSSAMGAPAAVARSPTRSGHAARC
jgi:hypothetical protein